MNKSRTVEYLNIKKVDGKHKWEKLATTQKLFPGNYGALFHCAKTYKISRILQAMLLNNSTESLVETGVYTEQTKGKT